MLTWIDEGTMFETTVSCDGGPLEFGKFDFSEICISIPVCNGWLLTTKSNLESPKWDWPNNGDVLYMFEKVENETRTSYKSYINFWDQTWMGKLTQNNELLLEELWHW